MAGSLYAQRLRNQTSLASAFFCVSVKFDLTSCLGIYITRAQYEQQSIHFSNSLFNLQLFKVPKPITCRKFGILRAPMGLGLQAICSVLHGEADDIYVIVASP